MCEADPLIHVVDLSHPNFQEQIQAVHAVIRELDADGKQMLTVFNKIDAVSNPDLIQAQVRRTPNSVPMTSIPTIVMGTWKRILGYLKSSRLEHGLLINFGACKFEIRKYAWTEDSPKRRQITLGHCSL